SERDLTDRQPAASVCIDADAPSDPRAAALRACRHTVEWTTRWARTVASIVGYVTARSTGEPLGFADATVEEYGIGTFAQSNGVFRLRGVPTGAVTLRVRRLGFTPVSLHLTL